MPFSLSVYLYRKYQESYQKKFEKTNRILSSEQIKGLLEGPDRSFMIRVFSSAVVDHAPVDGTPYYLMAPVAPLFYHDNFKHSLIASGLGEMSGKFDYEQTLEAVRILDELRDSEQAGYVQIFAWHALGRIARENNAFFEEDRGKLLAAFGGPSASLLGALLYLEGLLSTPAKPRATELIAEGRKYVRYKIQKALLSYFFINHAGLPGPDKDRDITGFLELTKQRRFLTGPHLEEGMREAGLISGKQKDGLQAGTQQYEIALRLKKICAEYLSVIGFYIKTNWK